MKAASEAWVRAVAHGFTKQARDDDRPLTSAAFGYRVRSLAGLEPALADAFVGSWSEDAVALNDTMTVLVQEGS